MRFQMLTRPGRRGEMLMQCPTVDPTPVVVLRLSESRGQPFRDITTVRRTECRWIEQFGYIHPVRIVLLVYLPTLCIGFGSCSIALNTVPI
jgi:hypothetical protein